MPARKGFAGGGGSGLSITHLAHIPDNKVFKFEKGEIVWAKMKFYSAWPAKVSTRSPYPVTWMRWRILAPSMPDHLDPCS